MKRASREALGAIGAAMTVSGDKAPLSASGIGSVNLSAHRAARAHLNSREVRSSRRHVWAAAILTAVLSVRVHEAFPALAPLRPGLLSVIAALVLLASNTSLKRLFVAVRLPAARWLLAFVLWSVLSVSTSLYGVIALETVIILLLGVVIFGAFLLIEPAPASYHALSGVLVVAVVVVGIQALLGGFVQSGRVGTGGARDPNDFAALIAVTLPFAMAAALRSKRKVSTAIWLVGVCFLGVLLLQTGSRGGLIAACVSTVLYAARLPGRHRVLLFGLLIVLGTVGIRFVDDSITARLMSITNLAGDYNSQSETGRIAIWKRGWDYALDNPMLGVGPGNFAQAEGARLARERLSGRWLTAHNTYVQVLVETGFPGALAYLGFVSGLFTMALRAWRPRVGKLASRAYHPELFASLSAFLISAIFLSHAYNHALFGLAGLIALGCRTRNGRSRGTSEPRQIGREAPPFGNRPAYR